ncbi:hypothetical protein DPMN_177095 [Dreissena polymorpha]|uniref:Uncharacterized protein n=1 Tax=Dreissena polymorpha TaxID=45954 RepID=A0A9D4EAL3_DREPO|nr:hypothetical protein DPMN_177095 [Dreissena polymorpha]
MGLFVSKALVISGAVCKKISCQQHLSTESILSAERLLSVMGLFVCKALVN